MCKCCNVLIVSLFSVVSITFSACDAAGLKDIGDTFTESNSNITIGDYQLTNHADFESATNILSIQNTREWVMWNVVTIDGEKIIRQSEELEPSPVGIFPPALRIGDSIWSGYSASFDFNIGESGRISFVLYDNSNIFCPKNSHFDGEQRFWFSLHSDGKISFETTSGVDSHYLTDDDGEYLQVKDFDSSVWNTITLNNKNNNLMLIVNGVEIAAIYRFDGNESGRLALDGSVGCMFKNICIE
ncbi:MAG: hypothetical protein K2N06_09715 [Oscillospiraceae bacterium]|nr:hypothetical protein [Oscillospiraceae bacterium]